MVTHSPATVRGLKVLCSFHSIAPTTQKTREIDSADICDSMSLADGIDQWGAVRIGSELL